MDDFADKIADVIAFLLDNDEDLRALDECDMMSLSDSTFTTDEKAKQARVKGSHLLLTRHAEQTSMWATSDFTTTLSTDEAIR